MVYLSLAVSLCRMKDGVSLKHVEQFLLSYPLVGASKKLVGRKVSEIEYS